MKREILCIAVLLLLLVACGGPQVSGRKATPTGAVVGVPDVEPEPVQADSEPADESKTAAEALQEVKENPATVETAAGKAGNSWYPPVVTSATGEDALRERTKAAFSSSSFNTSVDADRHTGSRYYDSDGDPTNLPEGYGVDQSYE